MADLVRLVRRLELSEHEALACFWQERRNVFP